MDVPFLVESSPGHTHGQRGTGRILPAFVYFSLPPVGRASAGKPSGPLSSFQKAQTAKASTEALAAGKRPPTASNSGFLCMTFPSKPVFFNVVSFSDCKIIPAGYKVFKVYRHA